MMHICTVATLCFPEKTFPRNYYYCVQDENSLCLCFKNMYRTLFVAIFTSTFIFSMFKSFHTYRNINISNPGAKSSTLQLFSSERSLHSGSWLHLCSKLTHWPSLHVNSFDLQPVSFNSAMYSSPSLLQLWSPVIVQFYFPIANVWWAAFAIPVIVFDPATVRFHFPSVVRSIEVEG